MKKNISINISGIIFHIEEDGYESLRRYLDSITKYFSTFDDSSEIMADIESRIAEIFLSKLSEGKQVITAEDVNGLITTMGSVSDFKAAEEEPAFRTSSTGSTTADSAGFAGNTSTRSTASSTTYVPPKALKRDQKRKILGGVCAGIASYLNVDALWVRLVFALFAFAWGFTVLVYIIMWIVVPGTYDLVEPEVGKKMFRDPERKILGGVSGGVASYLNLDILAVRILFILLTIAGGIGIFLYIILWVVLPEARTLTDRMQMQGEPVTLSNIESTLKKKEESEGTIKQESDLAKVILFPFRVIGAVLQALAKVLGPLAEAVRVIFGILLVGMAAMFLLSVVVTGAMGLGLLSAATVDMPWTDQAQELGIPLEALTNAIPGWVIFAGFVAALIPPLILLLLGISVIAKRVVFSAPVGWSLFTLFLVCIAMLAVGIPKIVYSFKESGEERIETEYNLPGKSAVLKVHHVGMDDYDKTWLKLRGHEEKTFRLVKVFRADGPTQAKAIENSKMISYNVSQQDSILTFDSNLMFKPGAIYRDQQLDMTLYIPYNYPFTMDKGMMDLIEDWVEWDQRDEQNKWQMTTAGLECLTCPKPSAEDLAKADLKNFDQLDVNGIFDVRILRGDEFNIELKGPEAEREKYNIYRSGKTLVIDFDGKKNFNWDWKFDKVKSDQVYISITMPELEKLEASGFGTIQFDEFHSNDLEVEIRGPIEVTGNVQAEDVIIKLTGKSVLTLEGRSNSMMANVEFASSLQAYQFEVEDAVVHASGASNAKVNVVNRLEVTEGMGSDVDYRGTPEVIKDETNP
jgi:phage shock protein PspC (stress-responsive transcriptional regulator)